MKKMVDLLEQENPGCFDDPGKTFLDIASKDSEKYVLSSLIQ